MAKDHHLDVAVQSIGGASDKFDQAAQQQVDEREEHGGNLPGEKRPDPTTSLAAAMITGFCALQPARQDRGAFSRLGTRSCPSGRPPHR